MDKANKRNKQFNYYTIKQFNYSLKINIYV